MPNHIMTTDAEGKPTFTCDGTPTDDCHVYPSCDCEYWNEEHDKEHKPESHELCLLANWYAHPTDTADMYIADGRFEGEIVPPNTSGPIEIEWDECPLWSFKSTNA